MKIRSDARRRIQARDLRKRDKGRSYVHGTDYEAWEDKTQRLQIPCEFRSANRLAIKKFKLTVRVELGDKGILRICCVTRCSSFKSSRMGANSLGGRAVLHGMRGSTGAHS